MLLLLACTAGPESSEPSLPPIPRVIVTEGSCTMSPDFEVDPAATIVVTTCLPADIGPRCQSEAYRILKTTNHISLENCEGGNATATWRITQILAE